MIVDAVRLPATTAVVGPAAVPLPVGVAARRRRRRAAASIPAASCAGSTSARARRGSRGPGLRVLGLVAALVAFALLLPLLGYVVTATALFAAAALLLDAPRDWRILA